MPINSAHFGLVTQLLDLSDKDAEGTVSDTQAAQWNPIPEQLRALGVGSVAEEVTLGSDDTVERFLELQTAAHRHGLETFLRLRELTDEALQVLREQAQAAAAKLAPGEAEPLSLRLMVDLGQPEAEDIARWLPRRSAEMAEQHRAGREDGPGGWGQALAFSLFAPDADSALRRLDQIGGLLLDAAGRPGVELPVWLAAFAIGDEGAAGSEAGVIQVGVHALSLGVERLFLAAGPDAGWWPADFRSPPPPLQAFRTLTHQLDGATRIVGLAPGQYQIEGPERARRYLLWNSGDGQRLRAALRGPLEVTSALGGRVTIDAARFELTDEPVFVASAS